MHKVMHKVTIACVEGFQIHTQHSLTLIIYYYSSSRGIQVETLIKKE